MKIKVKKTGEILDVDYRSEILAMLPNGCLENFSLEDIESVPEGWIQEGWEAFRRDAARSAMCGIIAASHEPINVNLIQYKCQMAILYADELIKQLKEGQK